MHGSLHNMAAHGPLEDASLPQLGDGAYFNGKPVSCRLGLFGWMSVVNPLWAKWADHHFYVAATHASS